MSKSETEATIMSTTTNGDGRLDGAVVAVAGAAGPDRKSVV